VLGVIGSNPQEPIGDQTLAQFSMKPIPSLIHFDAMILFFLVIFAPFCDL
jgi:hypothetical protein